METFGVGVGLGSMVEVPLYTGAEKTMANEQQQINTRTNILFDLLIDDQVQLFDMRKENVH